MTYNSAQLSWSSVISDLADTTRYNISLNCIDNCNGCNNAIQREFNETDTTFTNLCMGTKYQISVVPITVVTSEGNEFELPKKQCNPMVISTLAGGKKQ